MASIRLGGLLYGALAEQVRAWEEAGKVDDEELDRIFSTETRARFDLTATHAADAWARLEDVEELARLVADQLGGETGLVEWVERAVPAWLAAPEVSILAEEANRLVDGPGYLVSQLAACFVESADWQFEGSRDAFSVRIRSLEGASIQVRTLVGAALARIASAGTEMAFDIRFSGVDDEDLIVFGELEDVGNRSDGDAESRLHRAALVA